MTRPLHILTGFLGAGKTTVLDRLLKQRAERVAVLINEAGEVGLDHHLVDAVDGDVSLLESGCICCTVRSELSEALEATLRHAPERVVLETTGLAAPAPLVHAITTHPRLSTALTLTSVITVVDAHRGEQLLDEQPEAAAQLELADRVVLTKLDLAEADRVLALRERLARDYPLAEVLDADLGAVPLDRLLAPATRPRFSDEAAVARWLSPAGLGHGARTRVIELGGPVDEVALGLWLRLVTQLDGPRLLRLKGLVQSRETGRWVLLQAAQHAVSPPRELAARPEGWAGSKLVVITRGLDAAALSALEASAHSAALGARRG